MIYIVPIEPIDQRYTLQWFHNIPIDLQKLNAQVETIAGDAIPEGTSTGAFLDFGATNFYKASQVKKISELFSAGKVRPGDKFLVTDAWNFAVTAIRYMSDLLDIPVEIHGIWHAGAYDATDILGMKMTKPWPWHQEKAWFHACDYNYFATEFHKNMFLRVLNLQGEPSKKAIVSGQPHQELIGGLNAIRNATSNKDTSVIWPHRYNADKQPEIAEDLAQTYGQEVPWIITQKLGLDKDAYYRKLARSQVIFSCSLHENLGISIMEAVMLNTIPVLPKRCSYAEMYLPEFLYPSNWTDTPENYKIHKYDLINVINDRLMHPEKYQDALKEQQRILSENYLNANVMYNLLIS
jgi:hypothetical protein